MFVGYANPHTANDNTSGVLTLIEAMQDEEIRKKACFVFFDHEEIGLIGSANFAKKHKAVLENKLVINFDCVGEGDYLMMVVGKRANDVEDKLRESFKGNDTKSFVFEKSMNTLYPSDQMNFKKNVGVAAFKKHKKIGYYMDHIHTIKDTICEEENITLLVEGIKNYIS
jgi:Zn-dependent M28 family amino/carboxypeptidase